MNVWVLMDRGWEVGDEEVVAVFTSEEAAEAERKRRGVRVDAIYGPAPLWQGVDPEACEALEEDE